MVHRRLLTTILLLLVALIATNTNCRVAASSSTSNDTANANASECHANANDKNAQEARVCASRIVPPSNGDDDASAGDDDSTAATATGASIANANAEACEDRHADCSERAERGECGGRSAGFMLDECRLSCHVCGDYVYVCLSIVCITK